MTGKPTIAIDRDPREVRRLSGLPPPPRERTGKADATSKARKSKWQARQAAGTVILPVEVRSADLQAAMAMTGLLRRDELGDRERLAGCLSYVIRLWIRSVTGTRSSGFDTIRE